jgi:hypothetical protein
VIAKDMEPNKQNIDLIGDIHGHANELEALLKKLGYAKKGGAYAHPERTVLFLGDYIDRGPKIKETLALVRAMVDAGNAVALMGNHEYNALCYHTADGKGGYLRAHEDEKLHQHAATLDQFFYDPEGWRSYLAWFRTLPLWIDTRAFRAVHACWDRNHIELLERELKKGFTKEVLMRSTVKHTPLWTAVEETLKGKELKLPPPHSFKDKGGHKRTNVRIRWWEDPAGKTYKEHSVKQEDGVPLEPVTDRTHADGFIYGDGELPVFFGHYWLERHHKAILRRNICCLDHSVANKEIVGQLMAYRFDGEVDLNKDKLRSVDRMTHA